MAENTSISWATHTFNPWSGWGTDAQGGTRIKLSDGGWREPVKWNRRLEGTGLRERVFCASLADVFEDWQGEILHHKGVRLWHEGGAMRPNPGWHPDWRPVTMADLRRDLFTLIDATPNLDWMLLTQHGSWKGADQLLSMWPCPACDGVGLIGDGLPPHGFGCDHCKGQGVGGYRPNVWLYTSVSDQATADRMIPELLKCRDLVPVLGLSVEPLLGPVDLNADNGWLVPWDSSDGPCGPDVWNEMYVCENGHSARRYLKSESEGRNVCLEGGCGGNVFAAKSGIDHVIIGGESGPAARPCNVQWIRYLIRQCHDAGVPCFVKQLGAHVIDHGTTSATHFPPEQCWPDDTIVDYHRVMLRDGKGGDSAEWPADLRVFDVPRMQSA